MLSAMTVQSVRNALTSCGVALPPEAQKAADILTALQNEAVRDIVSEAIADTATTPLTAKNASARVQQLATALVARDRATEAAQHYEPVVLDQFRQAIVQNADQLILAMRPFFDGAAEVLHSAGVLIDPDVKPTANDGLDVVGVYQALETAQRQLALVRSARMRITELSGYAEADVTWFIESAADEEALRIAGVLYKVGWHRLTRAGYRLRLNLPQEAEAVATGAARGTAATVDAARQDRRAANRDPLREAVVARGMGQ